MKIGLMVNGLRVEAHYDDDEIENVHKPLLQRLARLHCANARRRTIVFLSAPPGTGKSTLTTFWEFLSRQAPSLPEIQTLPMDGFHHYNDWLDTHNLRAYKGAPETFDVDKLAQNLRQIREGEGTWPQYDRQKHDPVEDAIAVSAPIVIVEGNWLLRDDERWRALARFCDFSLFIRAPAKPCMHGWWSANWLADYRQPMPRRFICVQMGRMCVGFWRTVGQPTLLWRWRCQERIGFSERFIMESNNLARSDAG